MTEPIRYSSLIQARHEVGVAALIERAAKEQGTTVSEWSRNAHRTVLALQGFDLAAIAPRSAGELYDEIEGKRRFALVTSAGAILSMSYSDAKPEPTADDRGGVWVPVIHLDSQQFDIARHWRLPPQYVIHDTYGTPDRVECVYPVVVKSMEFA